MPSGLVAEFGFGLRAVALLEHEQGAEPVVHQVHQRVFGAGAGRHIRRKRWLAAGDQGRCAGSHGKNRSGSGSDGDQVKLQVAQAGWNVDRDRLCLQHALIHLALGVEGKIIGVGTHRHRRPHLDVEAISNFRHQPCPRVSFQTKYVSLFLEVQLQIVANAVVGNVLRFQSWISAHIFPTSFAN